MRVSPTVGEQADAAPPAIDDASPETTAARRGSRSWRNRRNRAGDHRVLRALGHPAMQIFAVLLGLAGTVTTALTALQVGRLDQDPTRTWWFDLPQRWMSPDNVATLGTAFSLGLGALTLAWALIGAGIRTGCWRIRTLWLLGAVWALPWVLAPMALSTDVYTYLGQGLAFDAGNDPYVSGPITGGLSWLLQWRIPGVWVNQPSPYGPLFTGINGLLAPLARHHLVLAVVSLRLIALAGLALAALCLPKVARRAGVNPVAATWLGVASPLALGAFALSGHNDALMLGFLVAALAVFTRREWRFAEPAAVALATAATMIKPTAAVALPVLAVAWARRSGRLHTGMARIGISVGVGVAVTAVVSMVTDLGLRWVNFTAWHSPELAAPRFTPLTAVRNAVCDYAWTWFGIGTETLPPDQVMAWTQSVAYVLAFLLGVVLLWKLPVVGTAKTIAILFAALVIISPVAWPWYLTWPVLLFGAVLHGRLRWILYLCAGGALFLTTANGSPHEFSQFGNLLEVVLIIALTVATGAWVTRTVLFAEPDEDATSL